MYAPDIHGEFIGGFTEKDYNKHFDYAVNPNPVSDDDREYPHVIFVGPWNNGETRMALVLKTVAYIILDENEHGFVVDRWDIKNHIKKSTD